MTNLRNQNEKITMNFRGFFMGLRRANHNVGVQYVCFVGLRRAVSKTRWWRRARMMKKNKNKDDDEVDDEQR